MYVCIYVWRCKSWNEDSNVDVRIGQFPSSGWDSSVGERQNNRLRKLIQ